jgi:L-ascorbate metabolism protein UlaG (beta-lactamase superfamily)
MSNLKLLWVIALFALLMGLIGIVSFVQQSELKTTISESLTDLTKKTEGLQKRTSPFIYAGEPVGYVITFENGAKFYFAGDTGFFYDMKALIGDYYKPDVAMLPIGDLYGMDPKLAAYAASLVRPSKYVVPIHYHSYPMLTQTPDEFLKEIKKYNLKANSLVFTEGEMKEVMGIKVLWLGHDAWYFETPNGNQILIDPEIENNLSYPEKYKDLKANFQDIDLILITHGHLDHATIPDLQKWTELFKPIVIAPFELGVWLQDYLNVPVVSINKGGNITKEKIKKYGIEVDELDNIVIDVVPADHSSGAFPPN